MVNMMTMIAMNCSRTRSRISFCDLCGEPPHHVVEAKQQDHGHGTDCDWNDGVGQHFGHCRGFLAPHRSQGHAGALDLAFARDIIGACSAATAV